ncbi:MAG TPA: T9SS type A sorting domain-containing protein [Bacteroidia bacterium]|jgi:hypothetical protein
MKNTSTIQKKLKTYSALAGTIAAAVNTVSAQSVVYTDVTPDSVLGIGGIYNLDLNNDAVVDFELVQRSGLYASFFTYDAIGVFPRGANAVDTSGGNGTATALDVNMQIDSSLNWLDSTEMAAITPPTANGLALVVPAFSISGGNFLGTMGKFLPLRFEVGGVKLYGWVRLDVAADSKSFTVKDYAYTNVPNSYSITGAMVGISEAAKNDNISIYSYDNNIVVKMDPNVAAEGTVSVTNLLGQNVCTQVISSNETFISLSGARAGIYMVTVSQSNGSYTKRISIN